MSKYRAGVAIAGFVALAVLVGREARAEEVVSFAPPVAERDGWFFGASIGRGRLDVSHGCGSCATIGALEEALSLSGHVGMLVNPSLGLALEGWMVRYQERDNLRFADSSEHLISETMLLASAQVWAGRVLWLRAGVGAAWHHTDLDYPMPPRPLPASSSRPPMETTDGSRVGPAAGVALGLEIAHTPTFGFELALRGGASAHDGDVSVTTAAITVGASWY